MYNFETFSFSELMECRSRIRDIFSSEPATLGDAAEIIVKFFHEEFVDSRGLPACPLVRMFKTHLFARLDDDLKEFARSIEPTADDLPGLRCLVLLATAGDEPSWNSRHLSSSHKAIPLTSEQAVAEAPMISQLMEQLGVNVASVLNPDPALLLDLNERAYNVFYVPVAPGSPYIVAQQEFVMKYDIQSVIGAGGMLASGDLFALILFSRVPISPDVASLFKIIGLNLKLVMLPLVQKPLFGVRDQQTPTQIGYAR